MSENLPDCIIPLNGVPSNDIERRLDSLKGLWKASSIIYLDILGLHTLEGYAIIGWNPKAKEALSELLSEKGWNSVVIRTDKKDESGSQVPRGGYLVSRNQIEVEICELLRIGRVPILLEPRNRFANLYGINVLYDAREQGAFHIEIVGPGFDVSDINRGDLDPHERIELKRFPTPRIVSHWTISREAYQRSRFRRLVKIGRFVVQSKLDNSSGSLKDSELAKTAENYLKQNGFDLLLQHSDTYRPIPPQYLTRIRESTASLPEKLAGLGLDNELFVISATVFQKNDELVFWDIVWPKVKYAAG